MNNKDEMKTLLEAVQEKDIKDQFKDMFPITKNLYSMRSKGTYQEDIIEEVMRLAGKMKGVNHKTHKHSWGAMSSESFSANADQSIGYYSFASTGGGIPEYVIGCKDKETWLQLRSHLKEEGLLR